MMPAYPTLAKAARIQGVVWLDAIIENGRIQSLTVIKGHPLMVPAAIEAVKQQVRSGTISSDQVQASAARVIALRARWPVWAPSLRPSAWSSYHLTPGR